MNNTTLKGSHEFQQEVTTMQVFHRERYALYDIQVNTCTVFIFILLWLATSLTVCCIFYRLYISALV